MLERIVHRHVSLGIRADQYPIVGRYLLEAVGDVLGDAVTPEVATAWDEVYWLFALELVAAEARIYAKVAADPASPWQRWIVAARIDETDEVMTLRLVPENGDAPREWKPGQYLSVAVDLPTGLRQLRQYSISSAAGDALHITIKRVDAHGGAPAGSVSSYLHATAVEGAVVNLGPVVGDVTLSSEDRPVALISAGIGITPLLAMLESLADDVGDRPVLVAHADRSPQTHALRSAQAAAARRLPDADLRTWYEADAPEGSNAGWMDLSELDIDPSTVAYLCGPLPFMRGARRQLLDAGVALERIHYEVFGPDVWSGEAADAAAGPLRRLITG